MSWTPITREEIVELIFTSEQQLNEELLQFWQSIKIDPEKWNEETHGQPGEGFWIVAICGSRVIYYNDIEEGFNISEFRVAGSIAEYFANQDSLHWTIEDLFDLTRFESRMTPVLMAGRAGL